MKGHARSVRDRVPVLVDCDNTMGLRRNEIDDGLTLLLLLAHNVELVGVTTTFGNGPVDAVTEQTRQLLARLGHGHIPVVRGAAGAGDTRTPAAQFIAESASRHAGELRILAIGSLTNLHGALLEDPQIVSRVDGVYAMGGYLGRLRFARREVRELNLSCDPRASLEVLSAGWPVILATAQLCLQARYGVRHLLAEFMRGGSLPASFRRELRHIILEWFLAFSGYVGSAGFYLWDLVPAWAMLHPARVSHRRVVMMSSESDLANGTLSLAPAEGASMTTPGVIDVPHRIRGAYRFSADCARSWSRAGAGFDHGPR
jgi:inosine-uridine nucleoside N-ribohydrolase